MRASHRTLAAGLLFLLSGAHCESLHAAKGAATLYLPGLNVPMGGFLPPPGVYFDDTAYFQSAKLPNNRNTAIGGNIVSQVKVDIWANFATFVWVMPLDIFGGNFAVSVIELFGKPDVRAGAILRGPILNRLLGSPLVVTARDAVANFGDPVVAGTLGWHAGNWHWKFAAAFSIPAGAYRPGELSNLAINRPVGDFTAGLTYLDQTLGIDLSAVGGLEVNGVNRATQYRTGNGLHLDLSATKFLTKELSIGVIASHYQQITADGGSGNSLGPYRGRVTAVGGTVGFSFQVGPIPVTTRLKLLREVEIDNRFKGTSGFAELSFPLWVAPKPSTDEGAVVRTRY